MKKLYVAFFLSLLIMGLSACGLGHEDVKQALENEGLQTEYTENAGDGAFELYITESDSKLINHVMNSRSEVREFKKSLLENAKDKNYQVKTFEAKNLLLAYYPSGNENTEVEKKIQNVVLKLK